MFGKLSLKYPTEDLTWQKVILDEHDDNFRSTSSLVYTNHSESLLSLINFRSDHIQVTFDLKN